MPERTKRTNLFSLFITFFKVGAFTIGGGYAMVPVIQREVIENHQWLDTGEFVELIAIAEMTPGPIAVNTATFVGYRTGGFLGSVMATLGVVLPSFSIILAIALFFPRLTSHPITQRLFYGIRPAVAALIGSAVFKLGKQILKTKFGFVIAIAVFLVQLLLGVPPIPTLLIAAVAGLLYQYVVEEKDHHKQPSKTGGK
jgi:chromate transporter